MRKKIATSDSCFLSELQGVDLEPMRIWRNKQSSVLRQVEQLTPSDQEAYWKKLATSEDTKLFAIVSHKEKFIGYCGFTKIHQVYLHSELSFLLDPAIPEGSTEYCNIFLDVLGMLQEYGFLQLRLNRLFCETHSFREKHIKVIEDAGFKQEGKLRSHVFKKSRFWDCLLHSKLKKDFESDLKERAAHQLQAVVFDFDDALVDEKHWIVERWKKTVQFVQTNLNLPHFEVEFWKIFEEKGTKYKYHVNDTLRLIGASQELVPSIVDDFLNQQVQEKLMPGVIEALQTLRKNYKLGIITNGSEAIQIPRIKAAGLFDYFDTIVCASETPKPNLKPYLDCCQNLNVGPSNAVYVSHDAKQDLAGAKAAGMSTALINFEGAANLGEADFVAYSYQNLTGGWMKNHALGKSDNKITGEKVDEKINGKLIGRRDGKMDEKINQDKHLEASVAAKVSVKDENKSKGILIVGAGILQKAAVEKAHELGYYVYITDMNTSSEAARMADEAFAISTKDIQGHVDLAKKLKEERKIVAVYTQGCDVEYTVAMAARAAGLPGIDPESALNCNDKIRMRTILNKDKVDNVKFASASTVEQACEGVSKVGFPCIIKPLDNSASRGVKVLHQLSEVEDAFEEAVKFCFLRKEVIIEEFLEGPEYSVDTVLHHGKMYPAGISDREFRPIHQYSVQTGSVTPSLLPKKTQEEMYEIMQEAARSMGVRDGAFKGDLIVVDGKPRIIEVTARTSGGFDSQYRKPYSFGIDIIKATIDIAAGKELDPLDLVPKWFKWSKTTSVFPKPGIISAIHGLEELHQIKGVKQVFHSMKIGNIVQEYKHCATRVNHIVIVADTLKELGEIENEIQNTLKIETKPQKKDESTPLVDSMGKQLSPHIKIAGRTIGTNSPVFIIAELSANHNQDFELAMQTIKAAKAAGADAIKMQTYTADTLTIDCNSDLFQINHGTLWDGDTLYSLFKKAYTPWDWQPKLKEYAESIGLICFSSPFDRSAVDFLEKMNVPAYKIASLEITDIPLIEYVASKQKPIIFSTGAATLEDIEEAIAACGRMGNQQIAILKCVSAYPTPFNEINLRVIPYLVQKFGVVSGLSDHSLGISVPAASVSLGSAIIEKHFVLDKKLETPDSAFSLDYKEFKDMVTSVREVEQALGEASFNLTPKMKQERIFLRSLFVVKDVDAGDVITEENVRSIRPGGGMHPKYLKHILGTKFVKGCSKGTPLDWSLTHSNHPDLAVRVRALKEV